MILSTSYSLRLIIISHYQFLRFCYRLVYLHIIYILCMQSISCYVKFLRKWNNINRIYLIETGYWTHHSLHLWLNVSYGYISCIQLFHNFIMNAFIAKEISCTKVGCWLYTSSNILIDVNILHRALFSFLFYSECYFYSTVVLKNISLKNFMYAYVNFIGFLQPS